MSSLAARYYAHIPAHMIHEVSAKSPHHTRERLPLMPVFTRASAFICRDALWRASIGGDG